MRINLASPERARQLAEYVAIWKMQMALVRCAVPSYLLEPDGTLSGPDYSASAPRCPICTLVRERRWARCALHR